MTLNEYEAAPIKTLMLEVERKLMLAKTSLYASTARGKKTISTRSIQLDVLKALLRSRTA